MEGQLTQWRRILTRAGFSLSGPPEEQNRILQELIDGYNRFRTQGIRHMEAVALVLGAVLRGLEQHRAEGEGK